MKRTATVALVTAGAIAAIVALTIFGRRDSTQISDRARVSADSVWYHASDVSRLARTGRPQLVEFFRPS